MKNTDYSFKKASSFLPEVLKNYNISIHCVYQNGPIGPQMYIQ